MIKNIRTIGPVQANPTGWRTGRNRPTGANLSLVFAALKVFEVLLFVVIYSSNCRLGCCSSAIAMWAPLENSEGSQCRTPKTERDLLRSHHPEASSSAFSRQHLLAPFFLVCTVDFDRLAWGFGGSSYGRQEPEKSHLLMNLWCFPCFSTLPKLPLTPLLHFLNRGNCKNLMFR